MEVKLSNHLSKMQEAKKRCIERIYEIIFGYDKKNKCYFQSVDPLQLLNMFKNDKFVSFLSFLIIFY